MNGIKTNNLMYLTLTRYMTDRLADPQFRKYNAPIYPQMRACHNMYNFTGLNVNKNKWGMDTDLLAYHIQL